MRGQEQRFHEPSGAHAVVRKPWELLCYTADSGRSTEDDIYNGDRLLGHVLNVVSRASRFASTVLYPVQLLRMFSCSSGIRFSRRPLSVGKRRVNAPIIRLRR